MALTRCSVFAALCVLPVSVVVAAACSDSTPAPASPYASSVAVSVSASASSSTSPPTAVTAIASAQAAARDAGIVDASSSDAAIVDASVSDAAPLQPPKPGPTNMQTCDRAIDIAKACPKDKQPISQKDIDKMIKDAAGSDERRKKLEMRCKDMLEAVSKQCLGEDVKLVR